MSFAFSNAQGLETFIEEALANSPEIQKFELQYDIVSEKVNEVNTIPNTEFGVGYFVSEPETRTGAQRFKVSAKQMLPSFGLITARENYASSLADAVYEDVVIVKRKLVQVSSSVENNTTKQVYQVQKRIVRGGIARQQRYNIFFVDNKLVKYEKDSEKFSF